MTNYPFSVMNPRGKKINSGIFLHDSEFSFNFAYKT